MCAVAVDVPLGDLPVVGARSCAARRCRRGRSARSSSRGSTSSADAADAVDAELDRRDAAVQRRPVVLHAGRHADRLALDVHRDLQQIARASCDAPVQRASAPHDGDRQRRRSGDAGAGRRLAARRQRRVLEPIVPREQREQRQLAGAVELGPAARRRRRGRCRSSAARCRRRRATRSATCARRLIAAFSVDAPS